MSGRFAAAALGAAFFAISSISAIASAPARPDAGSDQTAVPQAGEIIPGRFFIRFSNDVTNPRGLANALGRAQGFRVLHVYEHALRGMAISIPGGAEIPVLDSLRFDPRVRAVGNDRYISAVGQAVPKGVRRINDGFDPTGRAGSSAGAGVRVAIVDTGLDFGNADLGANIDTLTSRDCIGSTNNGGICAEGGMDDNYHGTFVGGIVAAVDNSEGVVGVASQTQMVAVKVLDSTGSGSFTDIIAGLDYLTYLNTNSDPDDDVDVANMSLGATCAVCTDNSTDPTVIAFHDATDALVASGTTVVVAAGNDGRDASTTIPASFDSVITVSALFDSDGQPGATGGCFIYFGMGRICDESLAGFSNYGADIDVTAPGMDETSLNLGGGTRTGSGTSFSAPHAAGVAAIFIASQSSKPSPATVRDALIQTGECAGGNGTVFDDGVGCSQVWSKDPDGIPEPMVRADNVTNYISPASVDAAVVSISADTPVVTGGTVGISVTVENQGTDDATFDVSLSVEPNDGSVICDSANGCTVTLTSGASSTVDFSWVTAFAGNHTITGTAMLDGDENSTNDSKSTVVEVQNPLHDVAVLGVSAPASVTRGDTAGVTVTVKNEGTFDETFDVSVTDNLDVGSVTPAQMSVALTAGAQTDLTFAWDTTSAPLGTHTLTAALMDWTDAYGLNDTATTTADVVEASPITLSTLPYKVKGVQNVDLTWSGATGTYVDIYRDGSPIVSGVSGTSYTDTIGKKGGGVTYTYQVCEAGTSTCSDPVPAAF